MPCMCGDLYCPSCGPAQGTEFKTVWVHNRQRYLPAEVAELVDEDDFVEPEPDAEDAKWDRVER